MNRHILKIASPAILVAVLGMVLWVNAGDINPPAGPVGPTMKTLPEVEPRIIVNADNTPGDATALFRITAPGSYYLTNNIRGVAGVNGIDIASDGVTLDLNGFSIIGVPGSLNGIVTSTGGPTPPDGLWRSCKVSNGSILDWGEKGAWLSNLTGSLVTTIQSSKNGQDGIAVGPGCEVVECATESNGRNGIVTSAGCTVARCTAYSNVADGINTREGCTVTGSSACSNIGNGIDVHPGSTVTGCTTRSNQNGIRTESGCTVAGCTSTSNNAYGIDSSDSLIRGNTAIGNPGGNINAPSSTLIENHAP